MLTKYFCSFVCLLLVANSTIAVPAETADKHAVLAVLTLNLARFSKWPEAYFDKTNPVFNLCVIGDSVVQQSFTEINHKKVNDKTVRVKNLMRIKNVKSCHLLYVDGLERNRMALLLMEIKKLPILTVGESLAFVKVGGMVGLENLGEKIELLVNLDVLNQAGLRMSSNILKLAHIVNYPILTE